MTGLVERAATLPSLLTKRYTVKLLVAALRQGRLGACLDGFVRARRDLARYRAARQGEATFERIALRSGSAAPALEHAQFAFASRVIAELRPQMIHDIGSHRGWIIGLGAAYNVTSLDVREPPIRLASETFSLGRAEALPWPAASVECLVSLHSIEHFGLGAYGDALEPEGDRLAAREIARVIKPGGELILTTTITGGAPFTAFNVHRVYDRAALHRMFAEFEIVEEEFFSERERRSISAAELRTDSGPYCFDLYLLRARRRGLQPSPGDGPG
jgi:SAM-dependent methyltransferase